MYDTDLGHSPEQLALVLPTSLCSGQVALRLADEASEGEWHRGTVTRTVALPHTEGCGVSGGAAENTYARMMTSYLAHPNVRMALLLEHGCEKTHNDYFRARLVEEGMNPARFGWASIQHDGGLAGVSDRVREWFHSTAETLGEPRRSEGGLGDLTVALDARGPVTASTARALALVGGWIVAAGGSVLLASNGRLLGHESFREHAFGSSEEVAPTVAHGQRPRKAGWHVMRMPTTDWMETASGLGAGGAQLLLAHVTGGTVSGQRLVPVVQVTADAATAQSHGSDLDGVLLGAEDAQARDLVSILVAVATGEQRPRVMDTGNVGFQITRGLLGTSM
jgi:altronate dehydratase